MTDEKPYVPAAAARTESIPYRAPASDAQPVVQRTVVNRPEPPTDVDSNPKPAVRLTNEEVRALLVVTAPARGRWRTVGWRSVILVPVGAISRFLGVVFGSYGWIVTILLALGALVWTAWPLVRRDELE